MSTSFTPSERTTPTRAKERVSYEKARVYQVLDEALHCDVAFIGEDGDPKALPVFHARIGDLLYLHGSTGSTLGLASRETGMRVCVTATVVDGLVYAKSWAHHSMNFRSVVAHGLALPVHDAHERWIAMRALVERMGHGRAERSREPSAKEDASIAILALRLNEVSVKQRSGAPREAPGDEELPYRNGVAEVATVIAGRL